MKINYLCLVLCAGIFFSIKAQDAVSWYNEGMRLLQVGDSRSAIEAFRKSKYAPAQSVIEFDAQIESLQKLIELVSQMPGNESVVSRYMSELNEKRVAAKTAQKVKSAQMVGEKPSAIELDLLTGEYGKAKSPTELYKEGLALIQGNNIHDAIKKFRDAKKAQAQSIEDFEAQIRSLEYLVLHYRQSSPDAALAEKYSAELAKCFDDAFLFATRSPSNAQAIKDFGKKMASILNSILKKHGVYRDLEGKERQILMTNEIARYLERDKEKYLKALGSSAVEELKGLKLEDALNLTQEGLIAFNQANEIKDATAKENLYRIALDKLIKASQKKADIYNVEYHLAIMFLKGLGTDQDLQLAQIHINNALSSAPTDIQKKDAQSVENEIEAYILMQNGLEKLNESKKIVGISTKDQIEKVKLEKEAFEFLQQASALYAGSFAIEFELAQMYHDAAGTDYDPARAMGHLRTAKNLATSRDEIADIAALEKEINERNAKVNAIMTAKKNEGTKEERGFGRLGVVQQSDRTKIMKQLYEKELAKPTQKSWMNRLFGTSKLQAKAPQRSSVVGESGSSSETPSSEPKRKSKSPFGLSL